MSETLFGVPINPKVRAKPNEVIWGVCFRHGSWYSGEKECPECFRISNLKGFRKLWAIIND